MSAGFRRGYNRIMLTKTRLAKVKKRRRGWPHELVSMAAIRRLAREIAAKFQPEEIILFGSYAYGKPGFDSDVDLLVVMPARNELDKSVEILNALDPKFSVDLMVIRPKDLVWRLREGDWFLREIMCKGEVLHEKAHG